VTWRHCGRTLALVTPLTYVGAEDLIGLDADKTILDGIHLLDLPIGNKIHQPTYSSVETQFSLRFVFG